MSRKLLIAALIASLAAAPIGLPGAAYAKGQGHSHASAGHSGGHSGGGGSHAGNFGGGKGAGGGHSGGGGGHDGKGGSNGNPFDAANQMLGLFSSLLQRR